MTPSSAPRPPASWTSLPVFLLLVVGGGLLVGALTGPDAWFASLRKPSFNPPNWLFGPVWTVLYVLIAIAGSRLPHHGRSAALPAERRSALMRPSGT